MAITNKNLCLLAERELDRLRQDHQETGQAKSLLQLSNGFKVLFEESDCKPGCKLVFETVEINGERVTIRLCKRPDGSICV